MIAILFLLNAVPTLAQTQYFPKDTFDGNGRTDTLLTNWYVRTLTRLNEPSLWELSKQDHNAVVFCLLYLPSFVHPISIRVTIETDGTAEVVSKITSGQGGYDPGL